MYQGKHVQRTKYSKRRANKRKATVLLISLALLIVLLVGTTTAFLMASDGPITNIFNSSEVTCFVDEEFEDNKKANVRIQNTGDTEAYIRATIVVTWKDAENGNVYGSKPVEGTDYTIDWGLTDWIVGNDGFYYYINPVASDGYTSYLIDECVDNGTAPAGYGLNVEILGSAIQSVPVSVVNEKWPAVHVDTPHGNLVKVN